MIRSRTSCWRTRSVPNLRIISLLFTTRDSSLNTYVEFDSLSSLLLCFWCNKPTPLLLGSTFTELSLRWQPRKGKAGDDRVMKGDSPIHAWRLNNIQQNHKYIQQLAWPEYCSGSSGGCQRNVPGALFGLAECVCACACGLLWNKIQIISYSKCSYSLRWYRLTVMSYLVVLRKAEKVGFSRDI